MGGPAQSAPTVDLIADIGGTNARFALIRDGVVFRPQRLHTADYPGPAAAVRAYLGEAAPDCVPAAGAFAVASPVTGDVVDFTNRDWSFSIRGLQRDLGFGRLSVVNDFAAIALAVPHLGAADTRAIGGGAAAPDAPAAVIGPGTGLGVSALVPTHGHPVAIPTEGGHVTLPAVDEREAAVIAELRRRFGHVSAERALSGPGLVNLHTALCVVDGAEGETLTPAAITERALAGTDRLCREALHVFCAMLGTVAGDLALSLGALGGVYIAGGIVPRLGDFFDSSAFRARFEAKGRFTGYMAAIPTRVITAEQPAFIGLKALLETGV